MSCRNVLGDYWNTYPRDYGLAGVESARLILSPLSTSNYSCHCQHPKGAGCFWSPAGWETRIQARWSCVQHGGGHILRILSEESWSSIIRKVCEFKFAELRPCVLFPPYLIFLQRFLLFLFWKMLFIYFWLYGRSSLFQLAESAP